MGGLNAVRTMYLSIYISLHLLSRLHRRRNMMELDPGSDTLAMPEMTSSELQTLLEFAYAGETIRKSRH